MHVEMTPKTPPEAAAAALVTEDLWTEDFTGMTQFTDASLF